MNTLFYFEKENNMAQGNNYAWPITAISKENYKVIAEWVNDYKQLLDKKKLIIFGAGIRGAEIAVILRSMGIAELVFTDNNQSKWGGNIDGFDIVSLDEALSKKEDSIYLVSVEEGASICKQLEEEGLILNENYFFPKPDLYDRFIAEYKRSVDNNLLILGDCMFEVVAFDDENKASLSDMIYEKYGKMAKCLTMHGLSLPGFLHMVRGQINSNMVPRCIIIMLNFETLTGKQHLLPRSQHTELVRAACDISPDPDGQMKKYLKVVEERVKNINAEFFTTNKFSSTKNMNNEMGRISDAAAKVFLKLNYLYSLDTSMESIVCLNEIMQLAQIHNIELIPFVPPVNYKRGAELFGEEYFEERYHDNLNKLKNVVAAGGFELLDLSHLCNKDEFAHVTTPDETTNYQGRKKILDAIDLELRSKGLLNK